jgi:anti-sigma B factor antagonist
MMLRKGITTMFYRQPSITVTTLSQRFDDQRLALLRAEFRHHVKYGRKLHVIDLDQVSTPGNSVFRALVSALRTAREGGGDVRLVSSQRSMRRVLTFTGLSKVFAVHASVEDAMIAFREQPAGAS